MVLSLSVDFNVSSGKPQEELPSDDLTCVPLSMDIGIINCCIELGPLEH